MRLMVKMSFLHVNQVFHRRADLICSVQETLALRILFVALKIYITVKFGCHQFVLILGFVFCFLYYIGREGETSNY